MKRYVLIDPSPIKLSMVIFDTKTNTHNALTTLDKLKRVESLKWHQNMSTASKVLREGIVIADSDSLEDLIKVARLNKVLGG